MILDRFRKDSPVASNPHLTEEQVNDLVDGLMRSEERVEIDSHLTQCEMCREEISRLAELVAASRADAEMVAAPFFLQHLVLATTIHERLVRRWMMRAIRRPIVVGAIAIIGVSSVLTGWVLLACPDERGRSAARSTANGPGFGRATSPIQCTEPWYFVVRDAARQRYKELRDRERDNIKGLVRDRP
jgi:predicted anti-sigma-YlaC factor YlaD